MNAIRFILTLFIATPWVCFASDARLPATDERGGPPKTLDTLRTFPEISSRSQWQRRAQEIREHVLVSCGLWPMPEKTPLKAEVFGRIERDGYTIEKVQFQTLPAFYLAGNLYRPLGSPDAASGFPAILNPHGHWKKGRLEDQALGSAAARCINFAKQGMIAFSYDMVGYNDTTQVNHQFAKDPTNLLWNVSLMGLQTWNSIRALDFLESLPDTDKSRLACTGESGGGTQTFMLGAIDDRLAVQAPIVMVSHSMQGGCLCENAPGLRLDYSNMEIAAVPAPRPQILVAATGDWTKTTMTIEGPSLEKIYRLYNAPDKLRYTVFDFEHNYNKTTREAVYAWFDKWLLHGNHSEVAEVPYQKETDNALRVWADGKLPNDALTEPQLIAALIDRARSSWDALRPKDQQSFTHFKEVMTPLWRHTLALEMPDQGLLVEASKVQKRDHWLVTDLNIGRAHRGDRVPVKMVTPSKDSLEWIAVMVAPEGISKWCNEEGELQGLAKNFVEAKYSVLLVDPFLVSPNATDRNPFLNYFSSYNRTILQERVQDIVTACGFAQTHAKGRKVLLIGEGQAGAWCLLAAPAAEATIADCSSFASRAYMEPGMFAPGIMRIGGFEGAAALAAPHPLLLHNTGKHFEPDYVHATYNALKKGKSFTEQSDKADAASIVQWAGQSSRN